MKIFEIAPPNIKGTALPMLLYHGGSERITKFRRPPSGVFFSPHKNWAHHYGDVLTECYVWAPKVYLVQSRNYNEPGIDHNILEALFDRDYDSLAQYIQQLQEQGYYALQTQTDSEMICVFSNAKIYSAITGESL